MSWHLASKSLGALDEELQIQVPRGIGDFTAVVRISGTFVGTMQVQGDQGTGVFAAAVVHKVTGVEAGSVGDPTTVGVYAANLQAGSENMKVRMTAYTSGAARVEVALVPASS